MEGLWYFGNTTVRNPYRMKDGLTALSDSGLEGRIRQREGDEAFTRVLAGAGVVTLSENNPDSSYSIGRKWRSALERMGFLYPKVKGQPFKQDAVGPLDHISPNGRRLIEAQTVAGIQECYLRALGGQLISYKTPSVGLARFNPLSHIILLLDDLERSSGETGANPIELALFFFTSPPTDDFEYLSSAIIDLRRRREAATSKRRFDTEEYAKAARAIGSDKPHTFIDYLDTNIRYLKATGIFQAMGRGISFVPEKRKIALELASQEPFDWNSGDALRRQCEGIPLPTDNAASSYMLLQDDIALLRQYGDTYEMPALQTFDAAAIHQIRYEVEERLSNAKEMHYAAQQRGQWSEISGYLRALAEKRSNITIDYDTKVTIPKSEAAAYMEWAVWRAFLAVDSISCKPYEVRRFNIDQDFLPISTAPGKGPDLIVRFGDTILAVEVTLTENSRQEAAEGEPVRRHVADLIEEYPGKNVLGLFIANSIDTNTAETFRNGRWYDQNDQEHDLRILPLKTADFTELLDASFHHGDAGPHIILDLIDECTSTRDSFTAPQWKSFIEERICASIASLCNVN